MPSHLHEVLIEMFRDRPALAADLLADTFGVAVPAYQRALVSTADLTAITPTEYRADVVVTLNDGDTVVLAVVIEVQLRRDARKRRTWPAYMANLHARLGCPVMLLVVCPDPVVAKWCAEPIVIGKPGLVLTPVVLGPRNVPVVTDVTLARQNPELAVLAAMAHGSGRDRDSVFAALLAGLEVIDHDHANLYADVVLTALPKAAREHLEALMTTTMPHRFHSDFAQLLVNAIDSECASRG